MFNNSPVAMALILAVGVAGPALAGVQRLDVGDLSQPSVARAFSGRLDAAAERLCSGRYRPVELSQVMTCERAVREEGLAQLNDQQRLAVAHALDPDRVLAAR